MAPRPKSKYRHMNREKAEKMRRDYFSRKKTQQEIADEHGVKQGTVSRIVSGQTWA